MGLGSYMVETGYVDVTTGEFISQKCLGCMSHGDAVKKMPSFPSEPAVIQPIRMYRKPPKGSTGIYAKSFLATTTTLATPSYTLYNTLPKKDLKLFTNSPDWRESRNGPYPKKGALYFSRVGFDERSTPSYDCGNIKILFHGTRRYADILTNIGLRTPGRVKGSFNKDAIFCADDFRKSVAYGPVVFVCVVSLGHMVSERNAWDRQWSEGADSKFLSKGTTYNFNEYMIRRGGQICIFGAIITKISDK